MLRFFPKQADDLLNGEALPATDRTELNYRTRPLAASQEWRFVVILTTLLVPLAVGVSLLMGTVRLMSTRLDHLLYVVDVVVVGWLIFRRTTRAFYWREVIAAGTFIVASVGSQLWKLTSLVGDWSLPVALGVMVAVASLVTHQVAAWILVGPTVDRVRMVRWRANLPPPLECHITRECPQLLTYSASPVLVTVAYWFATQFAEAWGIWVWPIVFAFAIQIAWFGWHIVVRPIVPWPSWWRSWVMTMQTVRIFLTYDIYFTPAAGVFRFPTTWLRRPVVRWTLSCGVLMALALAFGCRCSGPAELYKSHDLVWGPLVVNFLMMSVTSLVVWLCVLWCMGGTVLARFDDELSRHQDELRCDWENYLERMLESQDVLEREHLFLGTSEVGDYPILVHRAIHDQHVHITGDTGGNKTALAIAPQATQKIARGDCTVVVIDLKGDKALFECCREEAARRHLRFRWLANEVGQTTYAFNPLTQSHNQRLSVEQLTQELLQGLSLDYGLGYGPGYFSAMNEIVLKNVLAGSESKTFQELSDALADRHWYRTIGGHDDDWKQARHLSALVSRLAANPLLNVSPASFPDQPDVVREAIDVSQLLEEPQVVYLWLRSAVEPTNGPTIARLFLWSMFTAASHQPLDRNRVYFFIDEMQQVISEGIKLIFEQFRDMGGTIIGAHQTIGQLRRQGTDLGDTIDSCTAMKQVFRASDERTLQRLERLSGNRREPNTTWYQRYERGMGDLMDRYDEVHAEEGSVRVTEEVVPRFDSEELLAISARNQSSLVRFTFDSGYTQFRGATIPMRSLYHIPYQVYQERRKTPWPTAPGAFPVELPGPSPSSRPMPTKPETADTVGAASRANSDYLDDFDSRARKAAGGPGKG